MKEVCITVEDKGAGIEPVDRQRIFEPFYRSASAIAAQIRGRAWASLWQNPSRKRWAGSSRSSASLEAVVHCRAFHLRLRQ